MPTPRTNPAPDTGEYQAARWPNPADVPPLPMSRESAVALGRHAKAALMHLGAIEDLADRAGVDGTATTPIADLLRTARATIQDLDLWAITNAYRNGGDRTTYAGTEHWCATPGGVLPT